MAKKDDVYIALIKFVKNKTAETGLMPFEDGQVFLRENYPDLNETALSRFVGDVLEPVRMGNVTVHRLRLESYFHLLEHEELQHARVSSNQALNRSTLAIVISAFLAITSILIQSYNFYFPTNVVVDRSQIKRVLDASAEPHNVVLDQSQLEQLLKDNDRPMNVILDEKQLDRLLDQINRLGDASE